MVPVGVGIDVVEIDRVRLALERRPALKDRLFTVGEQEYSEKARMSHIHYATRFAAKEAVAKALGSGMRGVGWKDIEVVNDASGKPFVKLTGGAATRAANMGVGDILLSLSSSREHAAAVAVAVSSAPC